jgi:hypothetical protein
MSGWRKRTIVEMARESHMDVYGLGKDHDKFVVVLEAFAALVREDERDKWMERTAILIRGAREACWRLCDSLWIEGKDAHDCREAIRARGQA